MGDRTCRFCRGRRLESFADLGMSPLSNAFLCDDADLAGEIFHPLHAFVCEGCKLVQIDAVETPEHIFSDYAYFSSYSESWLRHAAAYAEAMVVRFGLGANSQVVELASNDGYLLQYFQQRGIPVLGIEPAGNVAAVARGKGIATETLFFGAATAAMLRARGSAPGLIVANNVLAHVPELNDFVAGMKILLAPGGVITVEVPHLLRLIMQNQFDTIYHEHFSYFSLLTAERVFVSHGLAIFDVEELPTHGGSLRLFAGHAAAHAPMPAVAALRGREIAAGLDDMAIYRRFAAGVAGTRASIRDFFAAARRDGKRVLGYGAPAKGNTLLNFCGITPAQLRFTVDRSPHKQGKLLPGTHIPVRHPDAILRERPDYLFILPWNLRDEVAGQMAAVREWGGRFVVPVPAIEMF